MKKSLLIIILLLSVLACKKKEFEPEGPTDVRIRNLSDQTMQEVVITTSEITEDTYTVSNIASGAVSDYIRVTKAYPKATITAKINVGGSPVTFSTAIVNFTYMQYIGRDRVTFEVYISNFNARELTISNLIPDEPLVLK